MRAKQTFPKRIELDSAFVTIYRTPVKVNGRTYEAFTVRYKLNGRRMRVVRGSYEAAEVKANDLLRAMQSGTLEVEALTPTDRTELVGAKSVLDGRASILEAARFYIAQHPDTFQPKTVSECVKEMLDAKKRDGRAETYLAPLRVRLNVFSRTFGQRDIASLTTPELDDWLRARGGSGRSRNNYRQAVAALVTYANQRHYTPRDFDPVALIPKADENREAVELFTPEELRKLLKAAENRPRLRMWLLLGAFAGIRSKEIHRLDWSDFREDRIELSRRKTKTRSRRWVPLLPNLKAWLGDHPESGPLFGKTEPQRKGHELVKVSGVPWKKNALRHSFISYRLALVKNAAQVALECGTSEAKIFKNYLELVTEKQAQEWFTIQPPNY